MPQAFAFIYVINTPNAGGVQKDRVRLSLLRVSAYGDNRTASIPISSRSYTRIIEWTSSVANRSLLFLSLFVETVSFENLELSLEVLKHKIQTDL